MPPVAFARRLLLPSAWPLPARISDASVELRPLRIRDCTAAGVSDSQGSPAGRLSRFRLWWNIRKRFDVVYSIYSSGSVCGMIGLYDISGDSAHVGLHITAGNLRGRGIGTAALRALAGELAHGCPLRRLVAEVRRKNSLALRFWRRNGFNIIREDSDTVSLSFDLRELNTSPEPR